MWKPDQEWLDMVSQQTYETLRDQWMPPLPPIEWGEYLVEILFKRGPVMSGAMGPVSMSDVDLRAYQDNSGVELLPWEIDLLLRLSREYLDESQKASKHFAPAPWSADEMSVK